MFIIGTNFNKHNILYACMITFYFNFKLLNTNYTYYYTQTLIIFCSIDKSTGVFNQHCDDNLKIKHCNQ